MSICPICNKNYDEPPALSRRDNKTNICPSCGVKEAIEDFAKSSNATKLFLRALNDAYKTGKINKQQFNTIKGQVFSGDIEGATKGLSRILERSNRK